MAELFALQSVIIKKNVPKAKALSHAQHIIGKKAFKASETKLTYRFRAIPKTKFISDSFRSKKVNKDITLVFAELKPEHSKLVGGGFMDYFNRAKNYVTDTFSSAKEAVTDKIQSAKDAVSNYLGPRLDDYPNSTKDMLRQYGDGVVTKAIIYRKPIDAYIPFVLNAVSLGKWNQAVKKEGYDKFFHLSLIVEVKGQLLNVEKLDVVSITKGTPTGDTVENEPVPLEGRSFTLEQMLEKARADVGDQAFFEYDSFRNNCQSFVSYLLKGQGLYGEKQKAFTYQPIQGIVDDMPDYVKKFQRGLTDISATLKKVTGQGMVGNEPMPYGNLRDLQRQLGSGFLDGVYPIRQPYARPDEGYKDELRRRQPYRPPISGSGIEDFVKDKGMELASGFADSLGGENFLGQVQEDITDVFSGRRVGDTARKRREDAEAKQKADSEAEEKRITQFVQDNPQAVYSKQVFQKLRGEIMPKWDKKFLTEDGYSKFPKDVEGFIQLAEKLRSKSEVDKLYKKVKKEALDTIKTGGGNPFIDLGNRAVEKSGRGSTCVGKMCMTEDEEQEEAFRAQEDVELQGIEDAVSEGRIPRDLAGIIMDYIPTAGEAYIQQLLQYFGDAYADRYYNASEEEQIRMIVRMREALERDPPSSPIRPSTEVVLTRFPQPRVLPSRDDEDDEKKQGDGKPFSRGYNFMRALNASKAPKNSQKASIVAWREKNAENADRINQSKFRKFDYDKVPKVTRNLARRTDNDDPEGLHDLHDPQGIANDRNYRGIYDKKGKKAKKAIDERNPDDLTGPVYYLEYEGMYNDDKYYQFSVNEGEYDRNAKEDYDVVIRAYDDDEPIVEDIQRAFKNRYDVEEEEDRLGVYKLTKKKEKKAKKPKKAPQQDPEEKEAPKPTVEELARGHYEAEKGSKLRDDIVKDGEDRFGKKEFNTVLVRVRKRMQRERDLAQGIKRKFK